MIVAGPRPYKPCVVGRVCIPKDERACQLVYARAVSRAAPALKLYRRTSADARHEVGYVVVLTRVALDSEAGEGLARPAEVLNADDLGVGVAVKRRDPDVASRR